MKNLEKIKSFFFWNVCVETVDCRIFYTCRLHHLNTTVIGDSEISYRRMQNFTHPNSKAKTCLIDRVLSGAIMPCIGMVSYNILNCSKLTWHRFDNLSRTTEHLNISTTELLRSMLCQFGTNQNIQLNVCLWLAF